MSLTGLSCVFPVPDIKETSAYYTGKLGFRAVEYLACQEPHICLYKDHVEIILLASNGEAVRPNRELYGCGYDAYIYAPDAAAYEETLRQNGVKIVKALGMTDYHNREFVIEDTDGRWIAFGLKQKE